MAVGHPKWVFFPSQGKKWMREMRGTHIESGGGKERGRESGCKDLSPFQTFVPQTLRSSIKPVSWL